MDISSNLTTVDCLADTLTTHWAGLSANRSDVAATLKPPNTAFEEIWMSRAAGNAGDIQISLKPPNTAFEEIWMSPALPAARSPESDFWRASILTPRWRHP